MAVKLFENPSAIKITDDKVEMEKIGKQFFDEKSKIYTDRVVGDIKKYIDKAMPVEASDKEKESVFYCSIYDYWVYGSLIMEWFAYDFKDKSHKEKLTYTTKKNFLPYYIHLNDADIARHLLANKYNAYTFLNEYYRRDAVLIKDASSYEEFSAFVAKHPKFVVKPVEFESGRGIHIDSVQDYKSTQDLFQKLLDEKKSLELNTAVKKFLNHVYVYDLLLEEIVNQADELAKPHPFSLNLIRITTINVNDSVKILYASFKIGANKKFLNNPAVGSFSAMINPKTGIVETGLFDEGQHCFEPLEYHPDTNVKIPDFEIPHWQELLSLSTELANKVKTKGIDYVGWDFALTPKGWCVLEGNDLGGVVMPQIAYRKGIKEKLEKLIGWKNDKKFWWE